MAQHRYRDSTHDLHELLQTVLDRNPYFAGRNIRVELHDNDVFLRGVVETYYQKQLAQESIRQIDGVRQIHNELDVIAR